MSLVYQARLKESEYPDLWLLHAIPNGGFRPPKVALEMKEEGAKAGVPDLFLPVPRGQYHGFYLEMKAKGGRVRKEQKEWLAKLEAQGYKTDVAWSDNEGLEKLIAYLELGPFTGGPAKANVQHPIQHLERDEQGVIRFKENKIVSFLLEAGPFDMNQIRAMPFDQNDREQFAQLIGYSLDGFGELSYVSNETYEQAAKGKP